MYNTYLLYPPRAVMSICFANNKKKYKTFAFDSDQERQHALTLQRRTNKRNIIFIDYRELSKSNDNRI